MLGIWSARAELALDTKLDFLVIAGETGRPCVLEELCVVPDETESRCLVLTLAGVK